jgi:hypothetical protein
MVTQGHFGKLKVIYNMHLMYADLNENYSLKLLTKQAASVAQWSERRRNLVILVSPVRIPLWKVGAGPYNPKSRVAVGFTQKRTITTKSHEC